MEYCKTVNMDMAVNSGSPMIAHPAKTIDAVEYGAMCSINLCRKQQFELNNSNIFYELFEFFILLRISYVILNRSSYAVLNSAWHFWRNFHNQSTSRILFDNQSTSSRIPFGLIADLSTIWRTMEVCLDILWRFKFSTMSFVMTLMAPPK